MQGIKEPGFLLENSRLILLSAAAWRLYIVKLSDSRFLIKFVYFFSLAALFFLIDVEGVACSSYHIKIGRNLQYFRS